jgi:hypothetical protein
MPKSRKRIDDDKDLDGTLGRNSYRKFWSELELSLRESQRPVLIGLGFFAAGLAVGAFLAKRWKD